MYTIMRVQVSVYYHEGSSQCILSGGFKSVYTIMFKSVYTIMRVQVSVYYHEGSSQCILS